MPIYVPENTRWGSIGQGIGAGIGNVLEGVIQANRQKTVANYLQEHPDATTQDLLPLAQGDPRTTELINNIMKGRLQDQQMQESKSRMVKDAADAERAHAGSMLDLTKTITEQNNQRMEGLKQKLTEAEIAEKQAATQGHLAEANKWKLEGDKAKQEISTMQAVQPMIDNIVQSIAPKALAPTPNDTQPTPGAPATPSTSEAPTRAGYPTGSEGYTAQFGRTIDAADKYLASPEGQGVNMSMRVPGTGMSVSKSRGPAVSEKETDSASAALSLAQALATMKQSIIADKDGKLKLGPVSGTIQNVINAFAKDPNNDNELLEVLTGHAGITTESLIPNSRAGYQLMSQIRTVLASNKKGVGFDLPAVDNSLRILANGLQAQLGNQVSRRAMGIDTAPYKEAKRIIDQSIADDPTLHGGTLGKSKGGATASPPPPPPSTTGGVKAYDPKKTYNTVGETFSINGKTYKVMKVDPNDPSNPDVEEVK